MVKKITWHKVVDSINMLSFNQNGMCLTVVGGKKVTLIKFQNELFATASTCPHAGGTMADGFVDAKGCVVCPLHRYRFDVKTGRNTSGEGYFLKTYQIENREDGIYLGIAESNFFDFF